MGTEGQSDRMESDVEEHELELLNIEKMVSVDIHHHLLNVYGDQRVDVSTVRWWMFYHRSQ